VGVGLGALLGPKGDFSALSDPAKCLLAFGMVLGRLEFVTIYALFSRNFWRA
jgi:trk system potassium uptake protein TrkH